MRGLSLRAIVIGLIGTSAICVIVAWADLVTAQIQIGGLQFPPALVGVFVVLVVGNLVVRRLGPRWSLNSAEVMVVYCMMLVAAMIASRGLMDKWFPSLVGINYYTTGEGDWRRIYYPHIRPWMVPFDPAGPGGQPVAVEMYEGLRRGQSLPWHLCRPHRRVEPADIFRVQQLSLPGGDPA